MSKRALVPIVEGHSEVQSVPVLLRRLFSERMQLDVIVAKPVRVGRYKVVRPGELERAIGLACSRPEGCDGIFVLLDADDDCPKELAPNLMERATKTGVGLPVAVVLAKSEFEAWFLASMESLRGIRGLAETAIPSEKPEEIRDAKKYLTRQMKGGRTYVEVDDQPALAEKFDLQAARQRCPSFDKFLRDIDMLLLKLHQ